MLIKFPQSGIHREIKNNYSNEFEKQTQDSRD